MQLVVNFVKYIALVVLFGALTGCGGNQTCYDADDFGFTTVTVSSRYDKSEIIGTDANQVAPWRDYNLDLSGKAIMIMVKNWRYGEDLNNPKALSAWCPWWGTKSHSKILSPYCLRLQECKYLHGYGDATHAGFADANNPVNESAMCNSPVILNTPCLMKRGVGLYVDIERRGAPSPNDNLVTMKTPAGVTFHLGAPLVGYNLLDYSSAGQMRQAGGVLYNYDGSHSISSSRLNYVHGKMYFKILDSYYDDNNGQYLVVIKSGLQEPGNDIFDTIKKLVQERLFGNGSSSSSTLERNGIVRTIYQNIIMAPGYSLAIRASLILYMCFTAILFLMGSIELTNNEILSRTIKIAIISALLNPTISWDFFNEYLFIWFYEGSNYIIQILKNAANIGPGDGNILTFLTTIQIMTKLISLLFATWQGWLYILVYFIMLIFLTMVLFDAAVLYMTAQVMMGLLICLAPIFIAFYLFEATKSFFENWLKQLIGYALQCVLVSAGILFMTMIIRNQIYNTLGFRVCLEEFPNMNFASGGGLNNLLQGSEAGDTPVISLFAWWFPQIAGWHESPAQALIPIPKAHFRTQSDADAIGFSFSVNALPDQPGVSAQPPGQPAVGNFCEAYECIGSRYPDLPFLDPRNSYEARQMDILRGGDVVDFGGLFIVVVCIFLLNHFNSTLPGMAKFLSGTTGNASDNAAAAGAAAAGLTSSIHAAKSMIDQKSGFKDFRNKVDRKIHNFWQDKVVGAAARKVSDLNARRLESTALMYEGPIAKKVAEKYGISFKDAQEFGNSTNKAEFAHGVNKALRDNINGYANKYGDNKGEHAVIALSRGKSGDMEKILAKELFKESDLSKLNSVERETLKNIMGSEEVQKMLDAKKKEELFQQAYLETYAEMGKGPLSSRNLSKEKRALKAERNVAWMDEMKRSLTGGILPSEADQMKYSDPHLRTFNEQRADEAFALQAKIDKRELDSLTIKNGRDIQRPELLEQLRAQKDPNVAVIDAAIEKNMRNDLLSKVRSDESMTGDTYIRTKATDAEFQKMIDNVYAHANSMKEKDVYNRQESLYKNNQGAMDELERRKGYIDQAAADEVQRLHDVRNSSVEEKSNIYKDTWSGVKDIAQKHADVGNKFASSIEKVMNKKKSKDE